MKKTIVSLFFLLASIALEAQAQIRDHAGMSILQPQGLKEWWDLHLTETHTSIASFGTIPWGRKIIGRLSLAEPEDACDYIRVKEGEPTHPVLVAMRGNCPFYMKAHYAQLAGAKMLIIIDNTYEEVESKLMVDTGGQGESVHIPSALLARTAGDKIKSSLQNSGETISNVHMVFDFYLPKSTQVEYRLWLSSSNSQTFRFLREWKQYYKKLESVAEMHPHYAHFKTFGGEADNASIENCICGNTYCTTDPDGDLPNTGRDVVYEDLRQMCILDKLGIDSWWDYVLKYDDICLTGQKMEECSRRIMNAVGIEFERIDSCVKKSFDKEDYKTCTSNTYLEKEAQLILKDGVILFPSVVINSFTYRGNLVPAKGVFETICESFDSIPPECSSVLVEPGQIRVVNHAPVVFAAVVFLLFFGLFVFCCYRRYLKREMYKQMVRDVNIAVSQYIAFKDDESFTKEKEEH